MRAAIVAVMLAALLGPTFVLPCHAAEDVPLDFSQGVFSPADVVSLGAGPDGARVTVRGEAIGDIIRAGGGGAWLNILGDGTAIGLWSSDPAVFEQVDTLGDYHNRGTIVEAVGIYNAGCEQHGGDRDVHVVSLTVITPGEPLDRPVRLWKLPVGLGLLAAAGVLWLLHRRSAARVDT